MQSTVARVGRWALHRGAAAQHVLVVLALATAVLAACALSPDGHDVLAGAYETHLSPTDACGFDVAYLPDGFVHPTGSHCLHSGTWRLELTRMADRGRTDERRYAFEMWHNGGRDVYGTLVATATRLTIIDEGGPAECNCGGPSPCSKPGSYEWQRHDDEFRLTAVSDSCIHWRVMLPKRPWTKVR